MKFIDCGSNLNSTIIQLAGKIICCNDLIYNNNGICLSYMYKECKRAIFRNLLYNPFADKNNES